jgi:hypothetical protein
MTLGNSQLRRRVPIGTDAEPPQGQLKDDREGVKSDDRAAT